MEPHRHAEESVLVLDAHGAQVCYGPTSAHLPNVVALEPGMVLHIDELEWHAFAWDPGGYADCAVVYGQVDNIRPDEA